MPEVPEPPEPPIDNVPEPVVTRYERVIVPKPEPVSEPDPLAAPKPEELKDLRPLTILNLPSDMQDMLEIEGWNVQGLASADPQELLMYPGIGGVWAGRIVERAKEALGDGDS